MPVFREKVLSTTISRILLLDEHIVRYEAKMEAEDDEPMFRMDEETAQASAKDKFEDLQTKVDTLMCLLLQYIDHTFKHTFARRKGREREAKAFYTIFQTSFFNSVLPSASSKYACFVMLHLCQKREDYVDAFINQLVATILGPGPLALRAIEFYGSFLARARYVTSESLQRTLKETTTWLYIHKDG